MTKLTEPFNTFLLHSIYFCQQKTLAQLEVERMHEERKAERNSGGLVYDKLKRMYDQEMQEMSEALAM